MSSVNFLSSAFSALVLVMAASELSAETLNSIDPALFCDASETEPYAALWDKSAALVEACTLALKMEPYSSKRTFLLGRAFQKEGKGEQAIEWYRKAAGRGHPTAAYNLSQIYSDGAGVPQDKRLGKSWSQRAKALGSAEAAASEIFAQFATYASTRGSVLAKIRKAAADGDAKAELYLGVYFWNGWDGALQRERGVTWLERSASKGEPFAIEKLRQIRR